MGLNNMEMSQSTSATTNYKTNRQWADQRTISLLALAKRLLETIIPDTDLSDYRVSTVQEDGDLSFDAKYGEDITVAFRARNPTVGFRDITIRSYAGNGGKSEYGKLLSGRFADYYLYVWLDAGERPSEFVLLDMKRAVDGGVFETPRKEQSNIDGTRFVVFEVEDFVKVNAVPRYAGNRITRKVVAAKQGTRLEEWF
jgi:hypothetical protein